MKKHLTLILFSLLFFSSDIRSQWYAQYISSGNFINDIRFINRDTGWACGSNLILKTTNGGTEWVQQNGHGYLTQIHPVNDSVGYVCGEYIIMKTTNGGDNWITIVEGSNKLRVLTGLWFINENTGWFCGDQIVMRTTNGGNTFVDSMYIPEIFEDIHFKDSTTGIICGSIINGSIMRTTNSGANWYLVQLPFITFSPHIYRETFIGDIGWLASGIHIVYKTTNYGITWDSISRISTIFNDRTYCIEFSSLLTGYAGGDDGKIYRTTDGGYNWQINLQLGIGPFSSIYAHNDSIVWATNGDIYNTVTGGLTNATSIYSDYSNFFFLYQNYPNPFNSSTIIRFKIQNDAHATLRIYDLIGKEVEILFNENLKPGEYNKVFDASRLHSGVYFYKLELQDDNKNKYYSETKKFLIVK